MRLIILLIIATNCLRAYGVDGIRIKGEYIFAYSNGRPTETTEYSFVALGDGTTWQIAVTNTAKPKEWGVLEATPERLFTISSDSNNGNQVLGYVFPGTFYTPEAPLNSVKLHFPWMAFCMSPKVLKDSQKVYGVDIPPPWASRHSLVDFGFRWNVTYDRKTNAVIGVTVTRDSKLDLASDEDELRRAAANYVFDYGPRDHRTSTIKARKYLPDGFVRATYSTSDIVFTNGFTFPLIATLAQYWPEFHKSNAPPRQIFQMSLRVNAFDIVPNIRIPALKPQSDIPVNDYRFQKQNERTKYNYAPYMLNADADLPSINDRKILAEVDEWFTNGPTFTSMAFRRKIILIGMSIVAVILGALLVFRLVAKIKQKQS